MKRLELTPDGFPCTLAECPPGHFLFKDHVGFKSEYSTNSGFIEAFNEVGEYFHGDGNGEAKLCIVQPLQPIWRNEE